MIDYSIDIAKITTVDQEGGVFLYPTDTVWGLGASIANWNGIEKITKIKQRSSDQSYILLVSSLGMLKEYVEEIPPKIQTLMAYFNRPLTVIYKASENLDPRLMGPDGTVAIRVIEQDFLSALINKLGVPIISTSANFKGESPTHDFELIEKSLIEMVDYSVKGFVSTSRKTTPSAIVKLDDNGELLFIRE